MEGGGQSIGTWDSKRTLRQIVLWSKRFVRRDINTLEVWANSSVTGHLKRVQAPPGERGSLSRGFRRKKDLCHMTDEQSTTHTCGQAISNFRGHWVGRVFVSPASAGRISYEYGERHLCRWPPPEQVLVQDPVGGRQAGGRRSQLHGSTWVTQGTPILTKFSGKSLSTCSSFSFKR